ncbi:WD40/YVTN/BNR-like repeat-containing protein [Paenibacillus sp. Marseille-Q7038]
MRKSKFTKGITTLAITAAMTMSAASAGAASSSTSDLLGSKPAGSDKFQFSDIQFLTGNTGRAAGNGFMIGTSDFGNDWQSIYKGTWQFTQLDFINNTTGWMLAKSAANGPNALLYTKNGGSTLTKIRTGSMHLERISFKNENMGFGYSRAFTYRTTDGGKTWTKMKTPANTRYAEFSDQKKGYALVVVPGYGYKIHKTTDGGTNWNPILSVPSAESSGGEMAVDGNEVWVQLNGGAGMSQQSYALYSSRNAGKDWTKVISQDTAGGGKAPGNSSGVVKEGPASPGGHPSNLSIVEGGAYLGGFSPAGEKIGVGRSANGGKTWANLPSITGFESDIDFINGKIGWMADTSSGAIYLTKDGGETWTSKLKINK